MAVQYGVFLAGLNAIVRALPGGKVIMESAFGSPVLFSNHVSAVASALIKRTIEVAVTSDATATVVLSIPVAVGTVVGGTVTVIGKRAGAVDAIVSKSVFSAVNNGGTTAVLATAINQVVENSAGAPALTVVANDTTDTVNVTVAGIAGQSYTWCGFVEYQVLTNA